MKSVFFINYLRLKIHNLCQGEVNYNGIILARYMYIKEILINFLPVYSIFRTLKKKIEKAREY